MGEYYSPLAAFLSLYLLCFSAPVVVGSCLRGIVVRARSTVQPPLFSLVTMVGRLIPTSSAQSETSIVFPLNVRYRLFLLFLACSL